VIGVDLVAAALGNDQVEWVSVARHLAEVGDLQELRR